MITTRITAASRFPWFGVFAPLLRAAHPKELEEPTFRIWSLEHRRWWGPNCCGYADDMTGAGVYTLSEATEIVTKANFWVCRDKEPSEAMVPAYHG